MSFSHKVALKALLKAEPQRAEATLEAVIDSLPSDLGWADESSSDIADLLLLHLTLEEA